MVVATKLPGLVVVFELVPAVGSARDRSRFRDPGNLFRHSRAVFKTHGAHDTIWMLSAATMATPTHTLLLFFKMFIASHNCVEGDGLL